MGNKPTWTAREAAEWAGVPYRLLLDWLAAGLFPVLPMGKPQKQQMPGGKRRIRRAPKYLVPREAFMRAWSEFGLARQAKGRRAA